MADEATIRAFLNQGHPTDRDLGVWSEQLLAMGDDVPTICLDILKNGEWRLRPAALYGLRAFGYEAWAEGYWENEHYRIRKKSNEPWTIVRPRTNRASPIRE